MGDTVRYIISEETVQVLRSRSVAELAGMLARDGRAPVSLDELVAARRRRVSRVCEDESEHGGVKLTLYISPWPDV